MEIVLSVATLLSVAVFFTFFGFAFAKDFVARTGTFTSKGVLYRVTNIADSSSRPQPSMPQAKSTDDHTVALIKAHIESGKFDAVIARANSRNHTRRIG